APLRLLIRIDVVVEAADQGSAAGVPLLPLAVDREVAHVAVQHGHRPGGVVEEELQSLLAVPQALDDGRVLRLAVGHARLRRPDLWIGPVRRGKYMAETGSRLTRPGGSRYRLGRCPCPCPSCAAITNSMRAMPTMGSAEVRANSKGY